MVKGPRVTITLFAFIFIFVNEWMHVPNKNHLSEVHSHVCKSTVAHIMLRIMYTTKTTQKKHTKHNTVDVDVDVAFFLKTF